MADRHDEVARGMLVELREEASGIASLTELNRDEDGLPAAFRDAIATAEQRIAAALRTDAERIAALETALAHGIARTCAECDSKGRWCERCDLATGYRAVLLATESGRKAFEAAKEAIREEDANG